MILFRKWTVLFTLLAALCSFLSGCTPEKKSPGKVTSIKVVSGADQWTLPGEEFPEEVCLEVTGSGGRNLFGKKKKDTGLPGVRITLTPARGADLKLETSSAVTDAGGRVRFKVKAGKKVGDNYLTAKPEKSQSPVTLLRMAVGGKITGNNQEGLTGQVLQDPVTVQLQKADGQPAKGVEVYFNSLDPDGKVLTPHTVTDEHGIAQTHFRLGKRTGEYRLGVEVADNDSKFFLRQSKLTVMGIDILAVLIGVVGGLTFFVYGMELMSGGLQRVSGENMKKLLQFFSKNGFVAVCAGTFVTAVIQSSSATTVMVIGFINAGLLTLRQSIGIIFGANIGTTITAQIISFKLDGLALPSIALGFLIMLSKKRVIKGWGETLFGFGLIFFGMNMMSSQLTVLGKFPTFAAFFQTFNCAPVSGGLMPFGAVMGAIAIGVVATGIIQSSSASTGIVIALAGGGLVNFFTAIPLLIGCNIGTTITAGFAALTANRHAKQAALAHFLFNTIGAFIMLVLLYIPYGVTRTPFFLYLVNAVTPGNVFAAIPENVTRHIAMAHTLFNVFTVLLLCPFMKYFALLCEKLLPVQDESALKTITLEPRLLATPSIALEQSISAIRNMVDISWNMIDAAVNRHFLKVNTSAEQFKELEESEQHIDDMQTDITNYLVQITRQRLTQPQSNLIPLLMHCVNDAERIADHTDNIIKLTKRLSKANIVLSEIAHQDMGRIWELLQSQAENVKLALSGKNLESAALALEEERQINKLAKKYEKNYTRKEDYEALGGITSGRQAEEVLSEKAMENEEEINKLTKAYEESHIERRNTGKCAVDASVIFIEMLWELERIGDHLANIAARAPEIQKHYVALEK